MCAGILQKGKEGYILWVELGCWVLIDVVRALQKWFGGE
jgi:hypothetical protein